MVGVTLGTSVGCGIVLDGRLLRGARGEAGEIWRAPLDVRDPGAGTLHDALRGGAIMDAYESTAGRRRDGAEIARLAMDGDPAAREVFDGYGRALGGALRWLCDAFDPDVVVLGGAVSASFSLFGDFALKPLEGRRVAVRVSALGDLAGVLGAAAIALRKNPEEEIHA
jgi:predicted NBD/HSP70 family sugar kinase